MMSFDRFERNLPELFDELATPRLPDYIDDLLAQTAATRQRPGWSFPERWLPMSAISQRFAAAPRIPWRLGALVALLVVAALVATLVAGSLLNRLPPPFGPAGNGRIVYLDNQGHVLTGDPTTGVSTVLTETTNNVLPLFSQDGSRISYIRQPPGGGQELVVSRADGTGVLRLNEHPLGVVRYLGWSPTGDRLLLVNSYGQMLLFDTTKTADPVDLGKELGVATAEIGLGYNYRSLNAFRAGTDEIVFIDAGTQPKQLLVAGLDGSGARPLLASGVSLPSYRDMKGAQWSPDGSKLLFLLEQGQGGERWHIYVVNADGTDLHPLNDKSTDPHYDFNSPMWSPDGTRVAFQQWWWHTADDGEDFLPIGIVDVATGRQVNVGPNTPFGYVSWEWSPDGLSILEVPGAEDTENDCSAGICVPVSGSEILITDAKIGTSKAAPWSANDPINWQRVAR